MRSSRVVVALLVVVTGLSPVPVAAAQPTDPAAVRLGPATYLERTAPTTVVALDAALSKVGAPYRYGATGPDAFDCSGFTQWSFAQAGVSIPRTSSAQSQAGTPVPLTELRRGDLVFSYQPVSHVGFYLGDGMVLHAPTTTGVVRTTPMIYLDVRAARRY